MKFNYRIGIFGSVSSGKSTLINGIFGKHISQMNIRRSTMIPQVYVFNSYSYSDETELNPLERNKEGNEKFRVDIWDGNTVNYYEMEYPLNFLHSNPNLNFFLYDLPGLNDQKTKSVYMKWAGDNFSLFDCIIFVIDINSGLNTSDEIDICKFIFEKMSERKHVQLIVLVNKCDEMAYTNGKYVCDDDKENMFKEQIMPTLEKIRLDNKVEMERIHMIKYCSKNAFLYRTLYNNDLEKVMEYLDEKMINEIMQAEYGRSKWLKLNLEERKARMDMIVREWHNDRESYDNNMIQCGFSALRMKMNSLVNNPEYIYEYYRKNIMDYATTKGSGSNECLETINMVDDLIISETVKGRIIKDLVEYVMSGFTNYSYDLRVGISRENYNVKIGKWFMDLKMLQDFEDKVNLLVYVDKLFASKPFFEKTMVNLVESVEYLTEDKLFCKIVERRIIPSFLRYEMDLGMLMVLIEKYLRVEHWNNRVFFDWLGEMRYRRLEKFLLNFVSNNFVEGSWENIYYLYKFAEQIRGINENVDILCNIRKIELQSKLGYSGFNYLEIGNYKRYDEKYGDFLEYLIENFLDVKN